MRDTVLSFFISPSFCNGFLLVLATPPPLSLSLSLSPPPSLPPTKRQGNQCGVMCWVSRGGCRGKRTLLSGHSGVRTHTTQVPLTISLSFFFHFSHLLRTWGPHLNELFMGNFLKPTVVHCFPSHHFHRFSAVVVYHLQNNPHRAHLIFY